MANETVLVLSKDWVVKQEDPDNSKLPKGTRIAKIVYFEKCPNNIPRLIADGILHQLFVPRPDDDALETPRQESALEKIKRDLALEDAAKAAESVEVDDE